MKNFVHILCILTLMSSCKKDFLQRDTGVAISQEDVFKDPVLASRFADNSYNYMLDDYTRLGSVSYKGATSMFTDEAVAADAPTYISVINRGFFLDPNATDVNNVYSRMYQGIRNVNVVLAHADQVPWTSLQNGNLTKAQMYFLRGFFYYELVKRFGGVIILDRALSATEELDLGRNTYQETLDFILKDLQAAEQILATETFSPNGDVYTPAKDWDAANTGRPTVGAVKALKCRVLLLDASPLHNSGTSGVVGDKTKWKKAADVAKEMMDMGKYSLDADYSRLLNVSSSTEYILIKPRNNRPSAAGIIFDGIVSPGSGGSQGLYNPTQNHVDLYEAVKKDGTGKIVSTASINVAGSGYDPQKPYNNRDPRFNFNIIYNDQDWQRRKIGMWVDNSTTPATYGKDYNPTSTSYTRTRYYCRKLWPEAYIGGTGATALLNFIYFRYGEVLLNYAEAKNEADGPVPEVYDAIRILRNRVGMPPLPTGLTQDAMRTRVHNERAVEMAFEETRWWDLLRWKTAETIVPKTINAINVEKKVNAFSYNIEPLPSIYQRVFENRMYYYPIPQAEIYKSNGTLKQNPEW